MAFQMNGQSEGARPSNQPRYFLAHIPETIPDLVSQVYYYRDARNDRRGIVTRRPRGAPDADEIEQVVAPTVGRCVAARPRDERLDRRRVPGAVERTRVAAKDAHEHPSDH